MGKKGARKESEDSDKKKDKDKGGKRRARPPDLPLMDLVEGCPPHGRLVFEWVVGNGIGDAAVEDAQAAYERAFEVRRARGVAPPAQGPERSALAVFEYHSGAVGALYHSWETPSPLKGLRLSRIYGRQGSIGFESNGLFVLAWGARKQLIFPGFRDLTGRRASGPAPTRSSDRWTSSSEPPPPQRSSR